MSTLDISNNSLKIIQPGSFRTLKDLYELNLNGNRILSSTDFLHDNGLFVRELNVANCAFTQIFIPKNFKSINAWNNEITNITVHPNITLEDLILNHNNLTNLSWIAAIASVSSLHIKHNNIRHIDFILLSHFKTLQKLFIDLNPKQNISYTEIKKIFPVLNELGIESPDLSNEQQTWILNDFKQHKFRYIRINGNPE